MAVTIKTIARHAGVDHSTVSRALSGSSRVHPATAARIRAIAQDLGYTPSRIGRGLKTNRTYTLGLVVTYLTNPFLTEIVQGVEDRTQPANYSLFVSSTNADPEREAAVVRMFLEQRVDGILVCASRLGAHYRKLLTEQPVPIVLINNEAEGKYAYTVANDDRGGAVAAVEYLIGLGHRRIGYLGAADAGTANTDRLAGYRAALDAAGITVGPRYVQHATQGIASASAAAVQYWLHQPPTERPTAIFCFDDLLAIGALRAFKDAGLRVPDDISVVGFDDIEMAAYVDPPLTTFAQPKHKLGYRAGDMMLQLLEGTTVPTAPIILPGHLVVRQSAAAPPEDEHLVPGVAQPTITPV